MNVFVAAISLASTMSVAAHAGHSEHQHEETPVAKPRVFLDKNPRIVAYQLGRLSNQQLLLVDRTTDDAKYRPVFEAILLRPGISPGDREEAAAALITLNESDLLSEMFAALNGLDAESPDQGTVWRDLAAMVLRQETEILEAQGDVLRTAAREGSAALRRVAFAALVEADSPEAAAALAKELDSGPLDLLPALPLVPRDEARAALRDDVLRWMAARHQLDVRLAAIEAIVHVPAQEAENFAALAALLELPELRASAVRALLSIPKSHWPSEGVPELVEKIFTRAEATPPSERTGEDFLDSMQLADELLAHVPIDSARPFRERMREIAVRVVRLRTVPEEMRYDRRHFAVETGRPVQIVLTNDDLMPHNLVITEPGALREVAELAGPMTPNDRPVGKQYVPDSVKVIAATDMIPTGQQTTMNLTAPAVAGEYPFVCTFPQHWLRMYGVMVVVDDLDAWLANPAEPADPLGNRRTLVQNWKLEDLGEGLDMAVRGRIFDVGKRIFQEATCASCHKLAGDGGAVGPELTHVYERLKGDRHGMLREILEPSHKVDPKYTLHMVVTADGRILSGLISAQDETTVTLITNPESPQTEALPRDDIDEMTATATSMMPKGLMDFFTRDEICELLAYLESGGSPDHDVYWAPARD